MKRTEALRHKIIMRLATAPRCQTNSSETAYTAGQLCRLMGLRIALGVTGLLIRLGDALRAFRRRLRLGLWPRY